MTKITKERLLEIAEDGFLKHGESREMARMLLAGMEQEPVAWMWTKTTGEQDVTLLDPSEDDDAHDAILAGWSYQSLSLSPQPLQEYRKAAKVSFYRDGIAAAANWVDQQREAYDNEHGRHDSDTGTFEFGSDAQSEYSATLAEIAEGIRTLHPHTGNPPVIPDGWVMVPKEPTAGMRMAGIEAATNAMQVVEECPARHCWAAMIAAVPQLK